MEWRPEKYYKDVCTVWRANGMEWRASEQTDGRLLVGCTSLAHLTPEQAVAATLGRRTCHNESEYPRMFFCCSECGCSHKRNRAYVDMPRFCPACGRKVVNDG